MTRLAIALLLLAGCPGGVSRPVSELDAGGDTALFFPDGLPPPGSDLVIVEGPGPAGDGPPADGPSPVPDTTPPDTAPPCSANPELLDGKDNNCNNQVDEGFWASTFAVSYAGLTLQHPSCTASSAFSSSCMAAANRHCKKLGYGGGFGPVEYGPGTGTVVCLADALNTSATFASLTAQHPGCNAGVAYSLVCNSAIHRTCTDKGYVSGVGPVEHNATDVFLVCVQHAKVYQVSFATLASHHPSCAANQSFAPACQAAINRYCVAQGHVTGFGPVEQGTDAFVTCLDAQ